MNAEPGRMPRVVAHRGASGERAEQSLPAYELAIEQGADGLECDIRLTRDGHLVCLHDRTIDRVSDGTGVVSELTLAELQAFDFGDAEHPSQVVQLDQLIELAAAAGDAAPTLFIETKHPVRYGSRVERALVETLLRYGLGAPDERGRARVVMMSFSASAVWRMHRSAPLVPTVLLAESAVALANASAGTVGATMIGPSVQTLREHPELISHAALRGRASYVWTVDAREDVEFCRDLGVGWIGTNYPARTRGFLEEPTPR